MSSAMHHQRMHQQHNRQGNHLDRLSYPQQCKAQISRRPNIGNELLTKLEQAGKVPSREKFRRMCCQTFLATGKCPYNDRCVFLHDPRLLIESFRLKAIKAVRVHGMVKDTFYWPDMEMGDVSSLLDAQGLPDAKQAYTIPHEFSQVPPANHHDRAIYSMWAHFVDICVENQFTNNSCKTRSIHSPGLKSSAFNDHRSNSHSPSAASTNHRSIPLSPSQTSNHMTTLINHAHQSPKIDPATARQYLTSPISIANNLFSPQGTPDTSNAPTPSNNTCDVRQMETSEDSSNTQESLKIDSANFDRNIDFDSDPTVEHINKHLIGVWRLPMFVTLAGGSDRGDIPMNQIQSQSHYQEEDNDFLTSFSTPVGGRETPTKQKPINVPSFLPPPIGHEYNGRENSLRDLTYDQQRELNHSTHSTRSLYSDIHWSDKSAHKDPFSSQQNNLSYGFSSHTSSRQSPSSELLNDNYSRGFAADDRSRTNFEGFGQILQANEIFFDDHKSHRIWDQSVHNRANSFMGDSRPLSAFRSFNTQNSGIADSFPSSTGQHYLEVQQRKTLWSTLQRRDNNSIDILRQPLGFHKYPSGYHLDESKYEIHGSLVSHIHDDFISNGTESLKSNRVQSYHEHDIAPAI